MPTIYLRHPVHGTKVANMEAEANADVANGWNVYNPISSDTAYEEEKEVEETGLNALPVEVKRRRRN